MNDGIGIGGGIFILICIVVYFIPTIIAGNRKHPNGNSILALNIFLGWTFIGWVIAFVWACSNIETNTQTVIENKIENRSVADEIQKLAQLKEQGILTEEEFKKKKTQLLETK